MDQDIREDFQQVYRDLISLRERASAQQEINRELREDVTELTRAVSGLTSAIDKSRGALWVISGVSGAAGAVVSWLAGAFLHKPGG